MATKAKTKAGRVAERKSSGSQSSNRNKKTQAASPSALELLEQDHREVEEWFDEYNELNEDDNRKAELAEKIKITEGQVRGKYRSMKSSDRQVI